MKTTRTTQGTTSARAPRAARLSLLATVAPVAALALAAPVAAVPAPTRPVVTAPALAHAQQGLAGLDDEIEAMVAEWGIPGMALAVVQDDQITYARGFGVRETGGNDPVDEHTIFAAGSSSKAFTAAAIAILVDEGKASWDDLVIDHLPDFRLSDPYVTRDLRIRDLMSHNSGLLRGDRIWYASGRSREEVLHQVRHQPLTFPLRSTFQYNNTTWIAAGEVIEELSGVTWDDFVAQRIFEPLGMTRSTTLLGPLAEMENVAQPHLLDPEGDLRAVPYRNIDNAGPAGSINSSVVQMAQWVRLHLGSAGEYEGARVVSEEALLETHTPQMVMRRVAPWAWFWPESDFLNYGLGWFLTDYRDVKTVSHGGNIDGMTALVAMVPERNYGFVLLINLNGANFFASALVHRLIDRIEGGEQLPWSERMLARWQEVLEEERNAVQEVEESRVADAPPSLALAAYAGTYANKMYGEIVVSERDGGLRARFGEGFEGTLEHWHYDTFRAHWDDAASSQEFFRFEIGTDGQVAVLHAEIEGSVEFPRQR